MAERLYPKGGGSNPSAGLPGSIVKRQSGGEETLGSLLAAVDAVREADAAVGVAGERQAWVRVDGSLDLRDAIQVANPVLRHGPLRPPQHREERGGGDAEQRSQL